MKVGVTQSNLEVNQAGWHIKIDSAVGAIYIQFSVYKSKLLRFSQTDLSSWHIFTAFFQRSHAFVYPWVTLCQILLTDDFAFCP